MKRKFTLLTAAIALLMFCAIPNGMRGQTYTEVLTLNCAYASQNGSTDLYGTNFSTTMTPAGIKAFLKVAANESTNSGSDVVSGDVTITGDVYWKKGSGGADIPEDVLKIGKASGPGGISFTLLNSYDDIKKVSITGYGWKTTSAVSVNGSQSQSPTTAATEVTFDYVLSSASKTISIAVTSSAFCITEIVLYKESGGGITPPTPTVETPTFSPAEGSYLLEQTVSINCTTENVTIYYTLDGTNPTENSSVYSKPISITATTTLKAAAIADGYAMSEVATAIYTIHEVIPIADARALDNDAYACVEGTVILIDGRNVYVQDGTAGIDLYLNTNTVPANLAIGDNVRAYGKKTVYNGLVELTGIKGNNDNEFAILSNGNELPLDVQTVAALHADFAADNLLQSTRVKIENAIIGAINPTSTTVITQDGATLNVYKIPAVDGMMEGDWVTITGIVGCHNTPQLLVASAADVQYSHRPTLTATPTSLDSLTYTIEDGGPSEATSFLLAGNYLLESVYAIPSENIEISTIGGTLPFQPENPAMVSTSTNSFHSINIYVRLKAGLEVGTYNDTVTVFSQDADTIYIHVMGTVTGDTPTPVDDSDYVRIFGLDQLADGDKVVIASRHNATANAYEAAQNTLTNSKLNVVPFVSTTNADGDEILPASIVDAIDSYYWTVGVDSSNYTFTNANGDVLSYKNSTNFVMNGTNNEWTIEHLTAEGTAMVPNYQGFVVTNVSTLDATTVRALALQLYDNGDRIAPYSTSNMNSDTYNFYLDIFRQGEGGNPPTPPTPVVATPTFSPDAGTYYEAQNVTISCATDGATIYYTIDGTDPDESSMQYSNAITVNVTTTLKAKAFATGYEPSAIATASYVINMNPVVTATPLALSGFSYIEENGPSAEQSFTVSGTNLTDDITIATATDYEISLTSGDDFVAQSPLTLSASGGTVDETTVYVRLKANLAIGLYNNEVITITSTGTTDVEIVCSGAVITQPVSNGDYVRILGLDQLADGDKVIIASRHNATANAYEAAQNTLTNNKLNVVPFVSTTNADGDEILPSSIVDEENSYYWTVGVNGSNYTFTNAYGDVLCYNTSTNFIMNGTNNEWTIEYLTAEDAAVVPNYQGFVITNVSTLDATTVRALALQLNNNGDRIGPYSTSNMNSDTYNFYLDIFRQGDGGGIPTVAIPTFMPAGGSYYEAQNVTINCATDGATVYFSTTSEIGPWTEYENAISVEEDMTIWAYATKDGYNDSPVTSAAYSIGAEQPFVQFAMPMFIQGNDGTNNDRVPVAIRAYIHNFEPNTTYRYVNQLIDDNDSPETAGAGNVIYAHPDGFYRTTSPSLATEGNYGEFTTDNQGFAIVWLINEPTANARFRPGNYVYSRMRINNGHDGTTIDRIFTSEDHAKVLNFGTEYNANQGTAFYAKSNEPAMSFVALEDMYDVYQQPIYSTCIETVGIDYVSINQYADFYKELVAGKDGWFGGILPNDEPFEAYQIYLFDITGHCYDTPSYYTDSTFYPNGGLEAPIFIDLTDDGIEEPAEANVKVWNTDNELVIENGDNAHYAMTVYNILGQPLMRHQVNANSTIRLSHRLVSGVYIVSLQNNQNKVSVKVIVK